MRLFNKKNKFPAILLIVLVLLVGIFLYQNYKKNILIVNTKSAEIKLNKIRFLLDKTNVLAKAFSVYDITDQKEIYNRNGDIGLPIASLVKIMTAIVSLENYKTDDQIIIFDSSFGDRGANKLNAGEKWILSDLIKFTLISSSNSGAYALSQGDESYLDRMNLKANKIGMTDAVFYNTTGIDLNENTAGAYATARDVNKMAIYALKNFREVFHATAMPEMEFMAIGGEKHHVYNTNYFVNKMPDILMSKTGNTVLAGGNLCVIFKDKNGHDIAITLLGSTTEGRFSDMEKIINVLQYDYGSAN